MWNEMFVFSVVCTCLACWVNWRQNEMDPCPQLIDFVLQKKCIWIIKFTLFKTAGKLCLKSKSQICHKWKRIHYILPSIDSARKASVWFASGRLQVTQMFGGYVLFLNPTNKFKWGAFFTPSKSKCYSPKVGKFKLKWNSLLRMVKHKDATRF